MTEKTGPAPRNFHLQSCEKSGNQDEIPSES